ncbi:MAG: efflux RND transporter periplasmic adaptor subunit [Burkholderiaceae bacterium]
MRRKSLAGLLLVVLAAAGLAAGWQWRDKQATRQQYRSVPVERGDIVSAVSASGTINPVGSVSVGSQLSGQLRQVFVDFNSKVQTGQVLAQIDPESFQHRLTQAEADLAAAHAQVAVQQAQLQARRADLARIEATLGESLRDLERKRDLAGKRFLSEAEVDKAASLVRAQRQEASAASAAIAVAVAQQRSAEAAVRQRQAAAAAARVDLDRTAIRSPVDGVVIKRSVDAGQTVAASLQAPELFLIARNLHEMQVDTSIDETDIGRIAVGQSASFTVDAYPGHRFEGEVSQVRMAATNVQNVVSYNVIVTFSNADGRLLPGMTASVRIVTDRQEGVLTVPNAALRLRVAGLTDSVAPLSSGRQADGGRGGRLWLLEDGEPRMLDVRLGLTDGVRTEVAADGLTEGQAVVTGLAPGSPSQRSRGLRMF